MQTEGIVFVNKTNSSNSAKSKSTKGRRLKAQPNSSLTKQGPETVNSLPLPQLPINEAVEEFNDLRSNPLSNLIHHVKRIYHCDKNSEHLKNQAQYAHVIQAMQSHAVEAMWALDAFLKQLADESAKHKELMDDDQD